MDARAIAVDAMGGDVGVDVTVPATLRFLSRNHDAFVTLVGDMEQMKARMNKERVDPDVTRRLELRHAPEVVDMDESPVQALRNKKRSSMRVVIDLVKEDNAQACLSAGNTGALLAISYYVLRTLPGIERPALITELPGISSHTYMLDLGANVDCKAAHLVQFAVMGSVLVEALRKKTSPSVGLLNVGHEENKGNDLVKEADRQLRASGLNYIGHVEAHHIYSGGCDVIVTDGFSGNISLKSSEGAASFILHHIQAAFKKNIFTMLMGAMSAPVMRSVKRNIDSRAYNGATLLGLQGIVVKSHGNADEVAFRNAVEVTWSEACGNIPHRIDQRLERTLVQGE